MSEDDLRYPLSSKEEFLVEGDTPMEDWPGPSTPPADCKTDAPDTKVSMSSGGEETRTADNTTPSPENVNSHEEPTAGAPPTAATDPSTAAIDRAVSCAAEGAATAPGKPPQPDLPMVA